MDTFRYKPYNWWMADFADRPPFLSLLFVNKRERRIGTGGSQKPTDGELSTTDGYSWPTGGNSESTDGCVPLKNQILTTRKGSHPSVISILPDDLLDGRPRICRQAPLPSQLGFPGRALLLRGAGRRATKRPPREHVTAWGGSGCEEGLRDPRRTACGTQPPCTRRCPPSCVLPPA